MITTINEPGFDVTKLDPSINTILNPNMRALDICAVFGKCKTVTLDPMLGVTLPLPFEWDLTFTPREGDPIHYVRISSATALKDGGPRFVIYASSWDILDHARNLVENSRYNRQLPKVRSVS